MTDRYRAKRGLDIPMPDRQGQTMPDSGEGVAVDPMSPYYARLIAEGSLVLVEQEDEEEPAPRRRASAASRQAAAEEAGAYAPAPEAPDHPAASDAGGSTSQEA